MGTLYNNVLALCKEKGITGGKMCIELGLSKGLMTKLKQNPEKTITIDTAQKIADYFGVSVDAVLKGEQTDAAEVLPDELDELREKLARLSKEGQAKAEAYLDFLLSQEG